MRKLLLFAVTALALNRLWRCALRYARARAVQRQRQRHRQSQHVSGSALAIDRADEGRSVDRGGGVRTQPNVFYMGATGGGVWKTENYGVSWVPVVRWADSNRSIGALDVADSNPNVVYAGTGSEAIRSNVIIGRGVYKSIDAGKTWQYAGLKRSGRSGS